ncbi:acyl-CoA thioesterase [Albibacterium indicum]|uniref:acyl-CoA thioesterase n=1 Tax=Albibacterium indicum TaxID=2292082 RepID=UPI000E53F3C9|nr:acyl-CoA thioesterase [Pedobacter indicus]
MKNKKKSEVTFRFLAEPEHVNYGGKVHGGAVMKWIDQVAYTCAAGWSGHYCVTLYVGGIRFFSPIDIGDMVELTAKVIYTGNTSMHLSVDVYSGDLECAEMKKTTHCIIIFVAVDKNHNPVKVPKWVPTTEQEKELEKYAIALMESRKSIGEKMQPYLRGE